MKINDRSHNKNGVRNLTSCVTAKTTFRMLLCGVFITICIVAKPQSASDSTVPNLQLAKPDSTVIDNKDGVLLIYKNPKPFSFITQVPKTLATSAKLTFRKESIPAVSAIFASTILLISYDQKIANSVQQFGAYIHLDGARKYGASVNFNLGKTKVTIYDVPRNLNSGIYSMGEGLSSAIIIRMLVYGR